jgi:hypothetical protein
MNYFLEIFINFLFFNSNSNLKNHSGFYRAVPSPHRGGNNSKKKKKLGGTGGDTSKRLLSWPTQGATQGVGNGVLRLLPDHVRSGRGRVPARDVPPLLPAVAPREPRPLSCRRRWLAHRRATGGSARPAFAFGAGASRGDRYGGRPAVKVKQASHDPHDDMTRTALGSRG